MSRNPFSSITVRSNTKILKSEIHSCLIYDQKGLNPDI